ncbi:hypothetical protein EXE48_18180, partial [Halorubrum sp. ASP1]|uniref:hypothetical protein n=1 Tax=Halorubrum sp. ASP1 TaxID=2518114 RepID=UPI0010F7BEB6
MSINNDYKGKGRLIRRNRRERFERNSEKRGKIEKEKKERKEGEGRGRIERDYDLTVECRDLGEGGEE